MYLSRLTESGVRALYSYRPFQDLVAENFGDWKEVASIPISMLVFGAGGSKNMKPEQIIRMKEFSKDLRKKGDPVSADWLDRQVKVYEKAQKAMMDVRVKKGMTPEEYKKKQDLAAQEAIIREAAIQKIELEDMGLKERVVPQERIGAVLAKTKMVDESGKPEVWIHTTDKVFNVFDNTKSQPNSKSRRNKGLNWFTTDPNFKWGSNVQRRYLNMQNPIDVGNVKGAVTQANIDKWKSQGYDGIIGYEYYRDAEGKRVKARVAATFGTQGIVNVEKSAKVTTPELLRGWANQLRSVDVEGAFQDIHLGSVLPVDLKKAAKKALEVGAKVLDIYR
jgi:hypothetical protein